MAYAAWERCTDILGEGTKADEYDQGLPVARPRDGARKNTTSPPNTTSASPGRWRRRKQVSRVMDPVLSERAEAHLNLGYIYAVFGNMRKRQEETLEAIRLDPDNSTGYSNLIQGYAVVNQLDKAKAMYQETVRRKLDNGGPHEIMYGVAFLERDTEEMERQANWATDKPGVADAVLSYQSDTEAFFGHLARLGNSLSARCNLPTRTIRKRPRPSGR